MDQRFTTLTRSLTGMPSRRHLLRGLAGAGLGLGSARLPGIAAAKKGRKKRKKKQRSPRPNEFGCLEVGDACRNASQCCSGVCAGKKGKKRCKAHDTGGCVAGARPEICGGTNVACTSSSGNPGECATTTGKAGYCVVNLVIFPCQTDIECQVVAEGGLGPTAACIRCGEPPGSGACAIFEAPPSVQTPAGGAATRPRS